MLSDSDWSQLGVKVGSKLRINERLGRHGQVPRQITNSSPDDIDDPLSLFACDLFLSHRHEGGENLAQAIKLQLQVAFPERRLRIFLGVDNLRDLAPFEATCSRIGHFLLLLTPGVLDRPFIQTEVQTTMQMKRNIHLVHDIKNCPCPDASLLPAAV